MLRRPSLDVWELNQAGKEIILWENFDLRLDIFFPANFVILSFLKFRSWAKQSGHGFQTMPRSKISDQDFTWDTRLSIGNLQWALGGPQSAW